MEADEIKGVVERSRIRDCIATVARGEDRRDAALVSAGYWPDATVDFGVFAGGFDAYLAWVVPGSPTIPVTQHVLGQTLIELDGDMARAESHVIAYHRIDAGEDHRDSVIGGRYLDRLEKRDGEWRIVHRTMLYDWLQDWGRSVDWGQGLMGMPFSDSYYTGRAVGDYSHAFFGNGLPAR